MTRSRLKEFQLDINEKMIFFQKSCRSKKHYHLEVQTFNHIKCGKFCFLHLFGSILVIAKFRDQQSIFPKQSRILWQANCVLLNKSALQTLKGCKGQVFHDLLFKFKHLTLFYPHLNWLAKNWNNVDRKKTKKLDLL